MRRYWGLLFVVLCTGIMVGCSSLGEDDEDVHDFVVHVQSRKTTTVDPMPKERKYVLFKYDASKMRDPFDASIMISKKSNDVALEADKNKDVASKTTENSYEGPKPDTTRPKELLESFSLDSLKMVGALELKGSVWGLVVDNTGTIHRVSVGNYMGQNFGKVLSIHDREMILTEWVLDGQGGWRTREASLRLPEQ